jgi:LuxR family maltose regulon positive regulatory protein
MTDLSAREREVADLYASGLSYSQIARELGLAPSTVATHVRSVLLKLRAEDRDAVRRAVSK